jgi:hypothetical protein
VAMRDRLVGVMQHRALQCRRAGGLLGLTLDGLQLQATTLRADWVGLLFLSTIHIQIRTHLKWGGMDRKLLSIEEMGRVGVGRVQILHWVCI